MESGPVFADPSGRRRRVLRFAGLGAAAVLAVCLGAVAVAVTGGPQAPFTQWAAPQATTTPGGHAGQSVAGHSVGRNGSAGSSGGQNLGGGTPGSTTPNASGPASQSPSPSTGASATPSASATATQTTAPTNPAGKTPPGRTKSPNPHKPSSAA